MTRSESSAIWARWLSILNVERTSSKLGCRYSTDSMSTLNCLKGLKNSIRRRTSGMSHHSYTSHMNYEQCEWCNKPRLRTRKESGLIPSCKNIQSLHNRRDFLYLWSKPPSLSYRKNSSLMMSTSSPTPVPKSRKSLRNQDNMWCSSSLQDFLVHIRSHFFRILDLLSSSNVSRMESEAR